MKETRISDLQLAAYLVAQGHRVVRVEGPPGRREFVFLDLPTEAVMTYYAGADQVSARKLFAAFRDLKGLTRQML